ncbi:MAG: SpoIIE family protein phosphatase [bacterium]|nr:SpoIIE family protein phosphatase [bacterium]
MNIAVLSTDPLSNDLLEQLEAWGHKQRLFSQPSELFDWTNKHPELEMVLLHGAAWELESIVAQLRRFPYYLYLMWLYEGFGEQRDRLFLSGLDEALSCQLEPEDLRSRLISLQRFFDHHSTRLDHPEESQPRQNPQTLNLEAGLEYTGGDRDFYRSLLEVLVETAEQQVDQLDQGSLDLWIDLSQNAATLGAEHLAIWVEDFFAVKRLRVGPNSRGLNRLKERYHWVCVGLRQGLDSLRANGYFGGKQPDEELGPIRGMKVLLVEDMKHNRLLLRHMFSRLESEVVEAVNGQEGVDAYIAGSFDLVVMDMNMPVKDGFTATEEIRQFEREKGRQPCPILALTALAMRGDREKCLAAGCDAYLPKPVETAALFRQLLDMYRQAGRIGGENKAALPVDTKHLLKVAVYTQNQIYRFVLEVILGGFGLECSFLSVADELLAAVEERAFDLVLMDQERNLKLAFLIRDQYPAQPLTLIGNPDDRRASSLDRLDYVVRYPFEREQLRYIIEFHNTNLQQKQRFDELIEDFNSLKTVKGQLSIEETTDRSGGQLAVWQKAFRKIGGDLVLSQSFNLHGRFGLMLADVSGHDVKSGYTASWFAGLVKGVWRKYPNPYNLLTYLNGLFDPETSEEDRRYVCALVLMWDPMEGKLYWANAGIPGGLLVRGDGRRIELNWKGMPLGMFPDMAVFDQGERNLEPGDHLILATDGILENVPGDQIGRLALNGSKPKDLLDSVVDFVVRSTEVHDDLTLAVFGPQPVRLAEGGYRSRMLGNMEATYDEVGRIKAYLDRHSELDFDWPLTSVAIKEALMNAVEHGNRGVEDRAVWVDVWLEAQTRLVVQISDEGPGFDLHAERQRLETEGQLRIQGRGIQLMEHIAKEISYTGASVRMVFEAVTKPVE